MSSSSSNESEKGTLATLGGDRCPVCGQNVRPAMQLDDYRLFACDRCGCWCSDALVQSAETSFSPDRYFSNADADRSKCNALLRRLEHSQRPMASALDVGCGTGAFLSFLEHRYPGIARAGIELDPERADLARGRNPGALIQTGKAEDVVEEIPGPFDLITLWDVFEHVPAPDRLLRSLATRLSAEGSIYIQTIHEDSLVPRLGRLSYHLSGGRLRAAVRRTHEAHHLVFFSLKGLRLLAEAAGVEIADLWYDRLALARFDGSRLLAVATSALLNLENALGNGLFVNLILRASPRSTRNPGRAPDPL